MENTAINLLTPFVSETKAAATDRTIGSSGEGSGSFLEILSRLTQHGPPSVEPGTEDSAAALLSCLDDVSLAVLDPDVRGLLDMIEAIAGGAAVKGDEASESTAEAGNDPAALSDTQSQTPGKDVENLLLGLIALFVAKERAAATSTNTATPDGIQVAPNALQDLALSEKAAAASESASSVKGDSAKSPATDDQATIETLALILFNSLQALQQNTEQAVSQATVQGQSPTAVMADVLASSGEGNITPKSAAEGARFQTGVGSEASAENGSQGATVQGERLEGFLNEVSGVGKESTVPEDEMTAGAEIRLTPSPKESPVSSKLTLTISGAEGVFGQNGRQGQVAAEVTDVNGTQAGSQEDVNKPLATTSVVEDLSSFLEGKNGESRHGDAGGKDGGSGKGEFQFMPGGETPQITGQETREKATSQAGPVGAVEKFQKVLDQFSTKASGHDLTVRLDIGNKESLLLGFKDMGQSIAVEVKASHQAIVDLLQNQKEAIVKHLESKDVHTNIQIDPDASATTDERERRETRDMRQRSFASRVREDGGFGEYLEVFA